MRLTFQITGLVLLPIAAFLGYQAAQLTYSSPMGPGPGFFPIWLCGLLGLLAVALIAQATFGADEPIPADFFAERSGYVRISVAVAGLLATAGLMSVAGFRVTTFVFYVILLTVFGR